MIKNSKIMVVYYSRTGTTKKAANHLAKLLNADCEELFDRRTYKGALGFLKAAFYALRQKNTALMPIRHQTINYDVIILCTPIWAGNITPAIRTYCQENKINNAAWLFTAGDPHTAINDLPTPADIVRATTLLGQKDIENNQVETQLQEFIKMI